MAKEDSIPSGEALPKSITLVSYPKIVYLYPTFLLSIGAGLFLWFAGDSAVEVEGSQHRNAEIMALVFLGIMATNLFVISFDFPRTTSLTLFFLMAAVGMGIVLMFHFEILTLGFVGEFFASLAPYANHQFYLMFAGIILLIYIAVGVSRRFDYWEVRPNELLHHHGFLSDLERLPAPNLRIDKEINDVFEYLLARSGRLILHASNERKAVILENVFFINRKERQITRMLGALQVQVRKDD